jgi:NADH:flavin oxidoreductases, Old Yellow Enzyme family
MSALLFEPITLRGVEFRNRIAMSPMCMHSASEDGFVNDFHVVHYGARALGGAGLIMLETASVLPNGPIGPGDIGIWDDRHVEGLRRVTDAVHRFGAKAGAQLGHAGRQLGIDLPSIAPSAIPFTPQSRVPQEMSLAQIKEVIEAFRLGARRAAKAGFDVVEVHCAHGYLLHQFLSPLANKRTDAYAGSYENRYRIVREAIDAVRSEWQGPLFVRVSTTDYAEGGNRPEDFLVFGRWMKEQGVDLIDCSTGGIAMVQVNTFPGYQVPAAELLRRELEIKTGAVGLIETGRQAEEILQNGRADMIFVGRDMLKDPFWARTAADDLKTTLPVPAQYTRYGSGWLRSQPRLPAAELSITVEQ